MVRRWLDLRRGPHDRYCHALGRTDIGGCTCPGQYDVAHRARRLRVRVSARCLGGLSNDGTSLSVGLGGAGRRRTRWA